jgi:hypothetical protein
MSTFILKKRDTLPVLEIVLLDDKDDVLSYHDLAGATAVWLHVRLPDGTIFTRAMVVDAVPTSGIVRYAFVTTDWTTVPALTAGTHPMECEVLVGASSRRSFPADGDDRIVIPSDIGQA